MTRFINKILPFLVISIAGILAYSNSLHSPLFFDDDHVMKDVADNHLFDHIKWLLQFKTRTVVMLTFKIEQLIHGGWLPGYHLTNIAIHILNGIFVYLILRGLCSISLKKSWNIPLWGALIFVCHPVQMQAVTYICQRFASLSTLFYFLTIYIFINIRLGPQRGKVWWKYLLMLFTIILASLSKEIAITIPFSLALIEFLFYSKSGGRLKDKILFFLPVLIIGLLPLFLRAFTNIDLSAYSFTKSGLTDTAKHTPLLYFANETCIVIEYIRMLFIPTNLHLMHRDFTYYTSFFHLPVVMAILFHATAIYYAFSIRMKNPLLSFGICFFYLTLAPESSFFPLEWPMFEYRLYLPMFGFSIVLPTIVYAFMDRVPQIAQIRKDRFVFIILLSFVCIFCAVTYQRNIVFRSTFNIWKESAIRSPKEHMSHGQVAGYYYAHGDYANAAVEFRTALSLTRNGTDPRYGKGLAMSYVHLGNIEKGLSILKELNIPDSLSAEEYCIIGNAYSAKGEYYKALPYYRKAAESQPNAAYPHANMAKAYFLSGDKVGAATEIDKAIMLEPANELWKHVKSEFFPPKK